MNMSNVGTFHRYKIEIDTLADVREFVDIATTCKGRLLLESGDKFKVNAKSLLGVLSMGIAKGMTITLIADGQDEELALQGLQELINSGLSE